MNEPLMGPIGGIGTIRDTIQTTCPFASERMPIRSVFIAALPGQDVVRKSGLVKMTSNSTALPWGGARTHDTFLPAPMVGSELLAADQGKMILAANVKPGDNSRGLDQWSRYLSRSLHVLSCFSSVKYSLLRATCQRPDSWRLILRCFAHGRGLKYTSDLPGFPLTQHTQTDDVSPSGDRRPKRIGSLRGTSTTPCYAKVDLT